MAWSKPEHSKRAVNRAGEALISDECSDDDLNNALLTINNWRTSHQFPLNTFQIRLRREAKKIDENCLIGQRIKRLSSIKSKLERIRGLNLAQIQDIGGCRAIVNNMIALQTLFEIYNSRSSRGLKHELFTIDDYVFDKPRFTGYRSIHLVYKYQSDKSQVYNSLKIEIQLRTILQHAWATAVETIDSFTDQNLKLGGGKKSWRRFFALMSSVIALREHTPVVPDTSDNLEILRNEIIVLEHELNVIHLLEGFSAALEFTGQKGYKGAGYFLLNLDPIKKVVSIANFPKTRSGLEEASNRYLEEEKNNRFTQKNIVLVTADTLDTLRLTYPNYYADTTRFTSVLKEVLSGTTQLSLF